ncbi:MAG: aspartate--tRNA ligase, partial [Nanoarchaeota archaeon]
MLRDITCNEISAKDIGKTVKLAGWVHSVRDHGGVVFIDLRDKYGISQVVFNNINNITNNPPKREYVIQIKGKVRKRSADTYNSKIETGEVEVLASDLKILSKSVPVPFDISDEENVNEDTRLKYRFLDLRRKKMQENLRLRHLGNLAARNHLTKEGFIEVETPMLVRSTPEGARDYVVPSRVNPGKFYALPQSPQLYKQILMVGSVDKYFQFARCLRDEDLRADRQPEHTQLDMEMSFVEQDDIFSTVEGVISEVVKAVTGKKPKTPFPRIDYEESMQKYGTDKPDLRFGLKIMDVTEMMKKSDFSVFKSVISSGGSVKMINPDFALSRPEFDRYIEFVKSVGGKGMAWMLRGKSLESNIVKYFPDSVQKKLLEQTKIGSLLFIADEEKKALDVAGKLRLKLAEDKGLMKKDKFNFCWVVNFPLFSWNEETDRWDPEHHMFTMPKSECVKYLEKDNFHPEKVFADCYDFVLNGTELASGSIRISDPDIQSKVMRVVSYTEAEIKDRFGFLLDTFKYGAPPHGGIGIGFDRLIAILLGYSDIREVIAFPKNKSAESLIDKAPSHITAKQLKELKLKLDIVK